MTEKRERQVLLLLCIVTDALLLALVLGMATLSRLDTLVYLEGLAPLHRDQAICLFVWLSGLFLAGAYNPSRFTDRFDSVYFSWIGVFSVGGLLFALASLAPGNLMAISRREILITTIGGAGLILLWRYAFGGIASRFRSLHREFFVFGPPAQAERIASELTHKSILPISARAITLPHAESQAQDARGQHAQEPFANREAIIAANRADHNEAVACLEFCETHFGRTFLYPSLHDMLFFRHSKLLAIGGVPLIEVANRRVFSPYVYIKRAFDMAVAGTGLLMAMPICIVTAIAIKWTSPGPLFYTQTRMGLDGRPFEIYKFRSMRTDAETQSGPQWATRNDDRVFPVGRFIRKHRIDEIPQMLNVLKGDMSMIGPRPERPHFHEEFCSKWPLFDRRLAVRPGVTSLSHVLGSYDSEPEDRLRYDLMYISSLSLVLDLKILVATVRVVLGAKGAQ
jgi:exopolysaccharide biosynthesis polyprenyl glycosylphosphotransferase